VITKRKLNPSAVFMCDVSKQRSVIQSRDFMEAAECPLSSKCGWVHNHAASNAEVTQRPITNDRMFTDDEELRRQPMRFASFRSRTTASNLLSRFRQNSALQTSTNFRPAVLILI